MVLRTAVAFIICACSVVNGVEYDSTDTEMQSLMHSGSQSELGSHTLVEVAQLVRKSADRAGCATSMVQTWGMSWVRIMDLMATKGCTLAKVIDMLTNVFQEGKLEALESVGISVVTSPPCGEPLAAALQQQSNVTMFLEATHALDQGAQKQVSEVRNIANSMRATTVKTAELAKSAALQAVACKGFTRFIAGLPVTLNTFVEAMDSANRPQGEDLLQMSGLDTQHADMLQSLQYTIDRIEAEISAFQVYAGDMVKYCTEMRQCSTTLSMWQGLDDATQHCIDVYSAFDCNSMPKVCKAVNANIPMSRPPSEANPLIDPMEQMR